MTCGYAWIIVAVDIFCAALLAPFAAVFMMELEEDGRVWYPGLWAFIGILGFCLFALSMGFVNVWDTAVK